MSEELREIKVPADYPDDELADRISWLTSQGYKVRIEERGEGRYLIAPQHATLLAGMKFQDWSKGVPAQNVGA